MSLEHALARPVTKITIEPAGDRFNWSLFDGDQCTFTADCAGDQVLSMLDSTGIILQTQLGIMPPAVKEAFRVEKSAARPSTN